jgi:hypothetical protein
MKIVIDIPSEMYDWLDNGFPDEDDAEKLWQIVKNGTPLPKGHGPLKDADMLKTAFPCGEYVRTECVRATIDHEDTIIEADRG